MRAQRPQALPLLGAALPLWAPPAPTGSLHAVATTGSKAASNLSVVVRAQQG
ncbi:unnamed protein product [Musa textilis]